MTSHDTHHYMDKDSKADLEMIESPNLKNAEQAQPEKAMHGVVPVGQIEMTDEEKKLVRRLIVVYRYGLQCSIFDPQHKRVNLKMDICILPMLSLLYLMNGLDRSNIGNAAVSRHLRLLLPSFAEQDARDFRPSASPKTSGCLQLPSTMP